MIFIGAIGVVLCLVSVVIFGIDITAYLNRGLTGLHFTDVLTVMSKATPMLWTDTINYLNNTPRTDTTRMILDAFTSAPITPIGLFFGLVFVVIGFRIKKYR